MMYRHPSNPRSQPDPSSRKKTTKSPPHKNPPPKNGLPPKNPIASRSKGRNDTPTITENSSPTDFINNAIHEYLLYREMNGTLDHFKAEVGKKSPEGRNIDPNVETQLMDAFEKGQREAFFRKWNSCIPANIRLKDEFCSKLEFYLHLYFVVFQIHPFTKKPAPKGAKAKPGQEPDKAEVQFFKHYLDTKGHKLAQTSEFLQFYALPYIPNPLTHPSFKDVFTREWLMELKGKLQSFVIEVVSSEQLPLVYQMYNTYARSLGEGGENGAMGIRNDEEYNKVVGQLESSNQRLMNILQEYNEKYENVVKNYEIVKRNEEIVRSHLFESNAKWISFLKEVIVLTSESFQVIDTLKKGVTIPENIIDGLKNKLQRYETFLNSNQEELFNTSQDNSFIDKASTSQEMGTPDHSTISNMNRFQLDEKPVAHQSQYPPLNFEKVKSFLVNPNNNEANTAALLQALGWRITKTPGMSMRREVIISYSKNDLLDLHRKEPCVIESLMRSNSRRVKESTARLINILTLDYSGRSYLLGSDKLVIMLINSLKQEEGDSVIRKNCLGALQKLSLRRRPQLLMIEQDMIKWIVMTLKKEKELLSEYSYEYATALFMNLSLRSMGKKKCEELELEVLKVLNDLLEHENMQVRSFVNGTLYSLLSKPVFKEHAKALGMNDILEYLMQNSDERYRKQIQYILEQLNTDKMVDDDAQSDTNDEDNDYDDMEDEDDFGEDEYIEENPNNPNVLTGEELLRKHFSLAAEPGQMNYTIQESAAESRSQTATLRTKVDPQTPLNRPTTPSMLTKLMQKENIVRPEGFETKPKIPRTPAELTREGFYGNQSQTQTQIQSQQPPYFVDQRGSYMNYDTYQRPTQQTQQYPTQGKPADTSQRSSQQQIDRKMSNEQDRRQSLNRMPLEENRQSFDNSQPMSQPSRNVETPGKEQKKVMGEDYQAFEAKPKIPRSPPDNMQRRR